MGYEVDEGTLQGVAASLRDGSQSVADLGGSVPSAPDAGAVSGSLGQLLSHFVDQAGELATGVAAAADAVEESGRSYASTDDDNNQRFQRINPS